MRSISYLAFSICAIVLLGCASAQKTVVGKQEWSQNYAREKGVTATSPLMIDGDPSTVAETQLPADSPRATATKFTEAVVQLPEVKSIRRIVVRNSNLKNFIVYASTGKEGDWKTVKEFRNNTDRVVEINTSVKTDKIKVRVLRTTDDTTIPGGRGGQPQLKHAPGKISEIEIYGLLETTTASPVATPTASAAQPSQAPGTPTAVEVPKGPPISAKLETTGNTFPLFGPIPLKITFHIGPDDLIVLADHMTDKMISTKLTVTGPSGEKISCAVPPPPLSRPVPKRFADKPVDVREARTLEANSDVTIEVPNLLDYYPMKEPGTYKVQLVMFLEVHDKFVGREQTEKEDIERQIREISAKPNYTPQEKAELIQSLREEAEMASKVKAKRYIEVNARGRQLDVKSNTIELTLQ